MKNMQKVFSLFMATLMSVAIWGTTNLYLQSGSVNYAADNAVVAVWSWGGSEADAWSVFQPSERSNIYYVSLPDGRTGCKIMRWPAGTTPSWEAEGSAWNKTGDISFPNTYPETTDMIELTAWNNATSGTWSKYTTPPVPEPRIVKLVPSEEWQVAGAKFAAWIWGENITSQWTTFFTPVSEGNDTLQAEILSTADSIDFVRFSPKTIAPTWTQPANTEVLKWGELKDTIDWKGLTASVVGWDSLTWKAVARPCESFGLLINGVYHAGKKNVLQTEWLEYKLLSVELKKNDSLQVRDNCSDANWAITKYASTSFEFSIKNNKYVVSSDGIYDFYLKFIPDNDEIYISKAGYYTQSVPSQCEDVLMQAFYNESYNNSAWGVNDYCIYNDNDECIETITGLGNTRWNTLTAQADTLGKYFDLIWLPPSSNGDGMGYHPKNYSNQSSNWGTSTELAMLIDDLHTAGAKVVADVVINHCQSTTGWLGFPTFNFGEYGSYSPDGSWICKSDEVNSKPEAGSDYGKATGSYDDGENWDGARDWSHDLPKVQDMFKAYLQWLRNEVGYDGFRYDKGDGFDNWHHDNYNKAAGPYIAFMECYSNTDAIWNRIKQANYNIMGLDFDTKWHVFDAIAGWDYNGKYDKARGDGLLGRNKGRYAVTFIDSHDWFLRSDNENEFGGRGNSLTEALKPRLLQANAFLLSMPGVPCVFYPHWKKYDGFLKSMIKARKAARIHSESEVKDEYATATGYQATIVGKDGGYLILCLGDKAHQSGFEGYYLGASYYAVNDQSSGHDASFQIWVKKAKSTPTDVEEVKANDEWTKGEKFLKDGQLYIRLGDRTYDAQGRWIQ